MGEIIKGFLSEWSIPIISAMIGGFFVWVLSLLPSRFQYPKRLNFALKVSAAVGKVDVSIPLKELGKIKEVKNKLQEILDRKEIRDVKLQNNLTFKSTFSGASYDISIENDFPEKKYFIIVSCFNPFSIGLFGKIKRLNPFLNELNEILELIQEYKKEKEKITIHIAISPRLKKTENNKSQISYYEKNFSANYNIKNIKIVNNGFPYMADNIKKTFYDWIVSLL